MDGAIGISKLKISVCARMELSWLIWAVLDNFKNKKC